MFFSLPVVVEAVRVSTTPASLSLGSIMGLSRSFRGYNETAQACDGLDGALYCLMADIMGPVHSLVNFFAFTAGIVLIMIGISRLTKSAQEGAKGPGGLGTMMTFI